MANWDVFHGDRGEVKRDLTVADIHAGFLSGEIGRDDLVRPAGTSARWSRLEDVPELLDLLAEPASEPAPTSASQPFENELGTADDPAPEGYGEALGDEYSLNLDKPRVIGPDLRSEDLVDILDRDDFGEDEEEFDPQGEDEEATEFTFTRSGPEKIEELDLAAMVDVAFQMVLFFLVTGTTILYKSLEVPKPQSQKDENVASSPTPKPLDDLKQDYILIEIDPEGIIKLDKEPAPVAPSTLINKLRDLRDKTGRKSVLVTADFKTHHKNTVLAIDAANEIGLSLALARPIDVDTGAPAANAKTSSAPAAAKN
ncbi:MAG: hypothetical protein NVSMB14_16250 [Isosphaeraceae bacterium]